MKPLAFIAHPLRGDVPGNILLTKAWYKFLTDRVEGVLFLCPWTTDCEVYDDSDEGQRAAGIQRNLDLLEHCDYLFLMGPHVSSGMAEEMHIARLHGLEIYNFTGWSKARIEDALCYLVMNDNFEGSV